MARVEWDMDAFRAVALWEFGQLGLTQEDGCVETLAQRVTKIVQDSCDAAADRIRAGGGRKRVYWWNDSIAQARRVSIRARRAWTKTKVKYRDSELVLELRGVYREAKRTLRREINRAKANAWT